eukprot:6525707-Prymnesium_polylepis.1
MMSRKAGEARRVGSGGRGCKPHSKCHFGTVAFRSAPTSKIPSTTPYSCHVLARKRRASNIIIQFFLSF